MRARSRIVGVALSLALIFGAAVASAQQEGPEAYEQKLKSYDPDTVAAAKAYSEMMNIRGAFEQAIPMMSKNLAGELKTKNPKLTDQQVQEFMDVFLHSALVDSADIIQKYSMIMMLDIYTKDELLALNQFYSSPVGSSILKKRPIMMSRIPEMMSLMMKYVIPPALAAARNSMKARGVEITI